MTSRMETRLRRLEGPKNPPEGLEFVWVRKGQTEDEAMQRHLEERPDATFSGIVIFLRRAVRPPGRFDSD